MKTFLAIKCNYLKMLRTLPTIWINYVKGVPHCWIPRNGFCFKLKNMAQPPNETDLKGRDEWYYSECEILFNKKEFRRVIDGEMALSNLNFDPEWYLNVVETTSQCLTTESGQISIVHPEFVPSVYSTSSSQRVVDEDVMPSNEVQSELLQSPVGQHTDNLCSANQIASETVLHVEPTTSSQSVVDILSSSELQIKSLTSPVEQRTDNLCTANEIESGPISPVEHFVTEAEIVTVENFMSLSQSVVYEMPSNEVPSELLQSPVGQRTDNLCTANEIESGPISPVELFVIAEEVVTVENCMSLSQSVVCEMPSNGVQSEVLQSLVEHHPDNLSKVNRIGLIANESRTSSNDQKHSTSSSQLQNHSYGLEEYVKNKQICKSAGLPPPMHYRKFEKMQWKYVKTFDVNELEIGHTFKSLQELSLIKRKYDKPFCRPGPLKRHELYDWYLVDSIVQKVHLKTVTLPFFVVRWVGYKDEFNTVEPLSMVKHTAVYESFINPTYTACRLNGCILRRSKRNVQSKATVALQRMEIEPSVYERTMNELVAELRIEEEAGRYSPIIGFCSPESVSKALLAQHRFFIDKFCLLIGKLQSPLFLNKHYIGPIFGNLGQDAEFKNLVKEGEIMIVKKPNPLADYISRGFSVNSKMSKDLPRYVSFMVQRKFDTTEKCDKKQMNFHMCIFMVRRYGDFTDAIYYDPSPKYFSHQLPPLLNNLIEPKLKSFTHNFGAGSEKDDCTFQCMKYIIGIATGEICFEPNLSEPCRKIDKFMAEKAKRMKGEMKN